MIFVAKNMKGVDNVRKVKCKICGKTSTNEQAYKVTKGKLNYYYCSKEEYDEVQAEKDNKQRCLDTVSSILDIRLIPPIMVKQIVEIREYYDYAIIERTFKECENVIRRFIETSDSSEYAKAKYIITIVANNINNTYKKWKLEQKQMEELFNNAKSINDEVFVIEDKQVIREVSDISDFLDD